MNATKHRLVIFTALLQSIPIQVLQELAKEFKLAFTPDDDVPTLRKLIREHYIKLGNLLVPVAPEKLPGTEIVESVPGEDKPEQVQEATSEVQMVLQKRMLLTKNSDVVVEPDIEEKKPPKKKSLRL